MNEKYDGEIVEGKKHIYTYLPGVDFRYTDAAGEWLIDHYQKKDPHANVFILNEVRCEELRRKGYLHKVGKTYCLPTESKQIRNNRKT